MTFTFKVGESIKKAWPLYKENFGSIILLIFISFIIQMATSFPYGENNNILLSIVSVIASILISYVWIKSSLSLIDGKGFSPFQKESLPSLSQFWDFIKTNILVILCVIAGFILFIIPGIYVSARLFPAKYISVEKSQGARKTIKEAWNLTKDNGWIIFWKNFLIGLFILAGFIAFFVGALITYPIAVIVLTMMYRFIVSGKTADIVGIPESISEAPKIENKVEVEEVKSEVI